MSDKLRLVDDRPVMSDLDKILSEACASRVISEHGEHGVGGVSEFYIETHCVGWWIVAKLVNKYEHSELGIQFIYSIESMRSESV